MINSLSLNHNEVINQSANRKFRKLSSSPRDAHESIASNFQSIVTFLN